MPETVTFQSQGVACAAHYYRPEGDSLAAIAMAHGLTGVKEMTLPAFAQRFAAAGIATLLFDYRYWGGSEGTPRGRVHPAAQIEDYRNALTWLGLRPEVDANRLGVWGTSLSGGHVLHLGAFDPRVKAVVSQVPAVDLYRMQQRLATPQQFAGTTSVIAANRVGEYVSGKTAAMKIVSPDAEPCLMPGPEAYADMMRAVGGASSWRNEITVDSIEKMFEHRPALSIELISPKPLLMMVATRDQLTPPDLALEAYERAREPKSLHLFDGVHDDIYRNPAIFEDAATRAAEWFRRHL